eukprot:24748-Eustigmatos_ZCMA.PRE.1
MADDGSGRASAPQHRRYRAHPTRICRPYRAVRALSARPSWSATRRAPPQHAQAACTPSSAVRPPAAGTPCSAARCRANA